MLHRTRLSPVARQDHAHGERKRHDNHRSVALERQPKDINDWLSLAWRQRFAIVVSSRRDHFPNLQERKHGQLRRDCRAAASH
jgi:hypothetical protein